MREYLRDLRKSKNLTQKNITERTGIKGNYYSMIEAGLRQKNMSLTIMKKLADALEVPIQVIVDEEEKFCEMSLISQSEAVNG